MDLAESLEAQGFRRRDESLPGRRALLTVAESTVRLRCRIAGDERSIA